MLISLETIYSIFCCCPLWFQAVDILFAGLVRISGWKQTGANQFSGVSGDTYQVLKPQLSLFAAWLKLR